MRGGGASDMTRLHSNHIERAYTYAREQKEQGVTEDAVIPRLKEQGFSILDSIKVIKHVYGRNLAEAKLIVTGHPAWGREAHSMDRLHQEILDVLEGS